MVLIGPHIMGHGGYDHPSNAQQIAELRLTRPSVDTSNPSLEFVLRK